MDFDDFWSAYPKRKGANPRMPAKTKFDAAVKKGADVAHIIGSAGRYRDESREQGLENTPYVCMAVTWLNQQRWLDYAPASAEKAANTDVFMTGKGYLWNGEKWEKTGL